MTKNNILIVDDDPDICHIISTLLRNDGHHCQSATNKIEAHRYMEEMPWDLIVLDVMLPDTDGYSLCKHLRKTHNTPVLFLTSRTSQADFSEGYNSGGDDYLTKPFLKDVFLQRVNAILRRYVIYKGKEHPTITERKNSTYTFELQELHKHLTDLELRLLEYFHLHIGECCTFQTIYERVWEEPYLETSKNTVMVHIYSLRKKIDQYCSNHSHIRTVWGKGYQYDYF